MKYFRKLLNQVNVQTNAQKSSDYSVITIADVYRWLSNALACTQVTSDLMCPKEFGGKLGYTEILCWDYKSTGTQAFLVMGGRSSSGDVVTHPKSGVLIMEDAVNFGILWTREFFQTNYALQDVRVQQVAFDSSSDTLFVALNPVVIIKMVQSTGTILLKKVLYHGANHVQNSEVVTLAHIPPFNVLGLLLSDSTKVDHYLHLSVSDLSNPIQSLMVFGAFQNYQVRKQMHWDYNPTTNLLWVEVPGYTAENGALNAQFRLLVFSSATVVHDSPDWLLQGLSEEFAGVDTDLSDQSQHVRIACLQTHSDLLAGGPGSSASLFFFGAAVAYRFSYLSGLLPPETVECRDAILTHDRRYFYFLQRFDGTDKYLQIIEVVQLTTGNQLVIKQTRLQNYQPTRNSQSYWRIFEGASGAHTLIYGISTTWLEGRTSQTVNTNYLMKATLENFGHPNVISDLHCGSTATNLGQLTLNYPTILQHVGMTNPLSQSLYNTNNPDSPSLISIQSRPLASYLIRQSGCTANSPTTNSIPKYLPSIDDMLYYVIGIDNLVNSGLKEFAYIVNASFSLLDSCQTKLLNYELKMKDEKLPLPHFISLDSQNEKLQVDKPVSADAGIYPLQIVLRDIYGYSEALDVNVIIDIMPSTPTDFYKCYTELGVVTQPFVQDVVYVVSTLKDVKVHFNPLPRTANGVNCESKLVVIGEWKESSWPSSKILPWFMTTDQTQREIKIFIPQMQGPALIGQTYRIRVRAYIRGHQSDQKSITFKVAIVQKQIFGCPHYYGIQVPHISDQVFSSKEQTTVIPFSKFSSPNSQCANKQPVETKALLTNLQSLPAGCIVMDFLKSELRISPQSCAGSLPQTFNVRAEAWIYDQDMLIKAPHNFVEFRVVIADPSSCRGFGASQQTKATIQRVEFYSNIDSPVGISTQYGSYLTMKNPSFILQNMGGAQSCENYIWAPTAFVGQDQAIFEKPGFISHNNPSIQYFQVDANQIIPANLGRYDIRVVQAFTRISASEGTLVYPSILMSQIIIRYQIYQSSKCLISTGNQPAYQVTYQIKRRNPVLSTYFFTPFRWATDGCIYDRLDYHFEGVFPDSLPGFILPNPANLSFSIATSNLQLIGSYDIQLAGYLNPELRTAFTIRVNMEEMPYVNTDAPRFRGGSLKSPVSAILNSEKVIQLPKIYDPDYDTFTVKVRLDGQETMPAGFVTYYPEAGSFRVTPTLESQLGKHKIEIELSDQHTWTPKQRTAEIIVIVGRYDMKALKALKDKLLKNQKKQYVGVRVEQVSRDARITLVFNVSVFNEEQGIEQFNKQSLTLKMKKAYTDDTYEIPWRVENVTERRIQISLNFSDPFTISQYSEKDSLILRFSKNARIVGLEDDAFDKILGEHLKDHQSAAEEENFDFAQLLLPTSFTLQQDFILTKLIPKQRDRKWEISQAMELAANIFKGSVGTLLFGNFILNIILQD